MRRLAAIMFTDIVGYSALMQKDEGNAIAIRSKHRSVYKILHESFNGTLVQYFGDGSLSFFDSAVEAVSCSIEIQKALLEGDIKVPVRIGIHLGDIFYDGTEIFGDGVNVAARIESISQKGAVLVSDSINNELQNQMQFQTESLGEFQFKNISEPKEVYAISSHGLAIPSKDQLPTNIGNQKSVAVLPFENLSPSKDYEYLSDGLTEEVINALTKIRELKVTSRTSAFHFKGNSLPISDIGEKLNVSTIVVGSVRLAGNKMRVSTQLVDVQEDISIWSETFDRSLENIFSVQDEISLIIAKRLREHVGDLQIDQQLVDRQPVSVDDYKTYLKSRYHLLKMTPTDIKIGMKIVEEVIEKSPEYVYGWLGMHLGYVLLGTLGIMKAEEAFIKAQPYLSKAIELSSDLAECQLQLAWMSFLMDWDLPTTYSHLQKMHDERPIVDYYQTMSTVVITEKKFKAAHYYIDIALKMDPFSHINHHIKGFVCYTEGNYHDAIKHYNKSVELNPGAEVSLMEQGQSLILLGKNKEALQHFEQLPETVDSLIKIGGTALAHASLGNSSETKLALASIEAALESDQMERALNFLILIETVSENYEKAIDYFERGLSFKLPMLLYIKTDPIIAPLFEFPRFLELMKSLPKSDEDSVPTVEKYKKSLISDDDLENYRKQLSLIMEQEQPYLDPYLSLSDLAGTLAIPANHLSQLLNKGYDQNFSEFVNHYRLTHFKQEILKPEKENFTLLAIAFECGFNSKTVFNSFFKKSTGTTPSKYLKSVR